MRPHTVPRKDHDRWVSIAMSVLLHGTIIGLLAYGWWRYEHRPVTPSVSVDATVVDAHTLNGRGTSHRPAPKPKAPAPKPKPVEPVQGPPAPTPREQALRTQAAKSEAARVAAAQAEHERLAQERASARAKALAEAKAKARKLAEQRRRARARQLAEERARALARKRAEARAAAERAARIAQLRQALVEDAQSNAHMRAAMAGWVEEVTQRVEAAWIKPASAQSHISCTVRVTLVQGGGVSSVSIGECNGDKAVRESIEAAVYRAAPLPPPPDPALYNQELDFIFAPNSGEP